MSTKTLRKRIALVAVSAMGFGLLSMVPAQAVATTLTASSTTGTISASASGTVANGTFSVTLVEAAATTWTNGATITLKVADKYGAVDVCTVKANDDGSPAGTVTMAGTSDFMFLSAASLPTLAVASGALTVTVASGDATYTDNGEIEHLTISGLTVTCPTTAPIGNLYIKVTAGTAELDPANVVMTGSVNQTIADDATKLPVRFTVGNYPVQAAYEGTNNVAAAIVNASNLQVRETTSAITLSPLWAQDAVTAQYDDAGAVDSAGDACTTATDQFEMTDHSLRTGDAIRVVENGTASGFTDATTYYAVVAATSPDCFGLASTLALAAAGTIVNGAADATNITLLYLGAGMPASLTIGSATGAAINAGSTVTLPASAATVDAFGVATSTVWLGKIGVVSASYKQEAVGTATAIAANTSFATSSTVGKINIVGTTGSIVDDNAAPRVTITLTNGVFYSAPGTVTGGAVVSTQSYPSATLVIAPSADTVSVDVGTYRFNTGVAAGSFLSFTATVTNDTNPTSWTPTALTNSAQRNIAILAGASISATPATSINIATTTGAALSPITITETGAGIWKTGQVIGVCFVDGPDDAAADEDTFYTAGGSTPWATVTSGNVKLAGNVSTLKGTMATAAAVNASSETSVDEDVNNQCVYWSVYSSSTTASTIVINGSNAANDAAASTGPVVNTASRSGTASAVITGGGALDSALVLNRSVLFTRVNAALYNVSLSSVPSTIAVASSAQSLPDVSITEGAKGYFAAGTITVDLSDSANADTTGGSFAATVGANAPVVTQTGASNIVWDYAITDGNTVTITVRTASSDAPATFKISNVKINTVATKSGGVAPASSDFFYEVSGAGMNSQSYSGQWGNVVSAASVTNADVLKSIVALIASINKQIQALQKLILKR